MPRPKMIMALAKVMIAAAWIDHDLSHEEINSLKDLLFRLPDMTASDWAELDIYMATPVGGDERERLIADLQNALASQADRNLAISALEDILQADGVITEVEREILSEIRQALSEVNVSIFGQLGRLARGPVQRRSDTIARAPNREIYMEDFMRNRIYYMLRQRLQSSGITIDLPESQLRKLSLAGGLMARVAYVDKEVGPGELDRITTSVQNHFHIERPAAAFAAEVAVNTLSKDLDYYRLSREFFESTQEDERFEFLKVLFEVAAADGIVSHEEMEEIRTIATVLKLNHSQFIEAKLSIPRDRRAY